MSSPAPKRRPSQKPVPPRNEVVRIKYTKFPNSYDELLNGEKLSGAIQRDIIWRLARLTWGADKRPEWIQLSTDEWGDICKTKGSTVASCLSDLAERKIIEIRDGKGCGKGSRFYKLTPEHWKNAKPYNSDVDLAPDVAETEVVIGDKLTIEPGALSPKSSVRLTPPGRDPVDFRVEYLNLGTDPCEISKRVSGDVLSIAIKWTGVGYKREEHKANTVADKRVAEFSTAISALFSSPLEKGFDPDAPEDRKLVETVAKNAGPVVPVEYFESYSRREFKTMEGLRKPISAGLLRSFALQAAKAYKAISVKRKTEELKRSESSSPKDEAAKAGISLEEYYAQLEAEFGK